MKATLVLRWSWLCLLAVACMNVAAQQYPSKTVRIVVPYPVGGGVDILARPIAQKVTEKWGQPVVIDTRPGANGNLGTELVAKSPPDGYTILIGTNSNLATSPSLYPKLGYDPARDLVAVSQVATTTAVVIVHPSLPVRSISDLISFAKRRPDEISYASAGTGSTNHLTTELFSTITGVKLIHVPYKGSIQAITDVISGRVPVMFVNLPNVLPQIRSGRLRAVAVTSGTRSQLLPEVPTIAEAGFKGFDVAGTWYGMVMPAGVNPSIVERWSQVVKEILFLPDVRSALVAQGLDPVASTSTEFAAFLKSEIARWAKVVAAAGARPD